MNNDSHADQPRDRGKFSFKTAPEAPGVRLGTTDAPPGRPNLERMIRMYAGAARTDTVGHDRSAASLALLEEAAKNTSTEDGAFDYLDGKWRAASDDRLAAESRKVNPWNVPGRIRRRRDIRTARTALDDAGATLRRYAAEMEYNRPDRRA
jgi:hypothetical protein